MIRLTMTKNCHIFLCVTLIITAMNVVIIESVGIFSILDCNMTFSITIFKLIGFHHPTDDYSWRNDERNVSTTI